MPAPSQTDRAAAIAKRLESLMASLPDATAPASPDASPDRAPKPVALTLRLDPARYERLNAHAGQFVPRRSFQSILVELIDAYLGDPGCGAMALDIMRGE